MWGVAIAFGMTIATPVSARAAEEYTISGDFDGCDYGRLYAIDGGGILECQEYIYFYEYRPRVIADGREVLVIGDERVRAHIYNGIVYETNISNDFDGCDFGKIYKLDNGLLFECQTYHYHYSYRPAVEIFVIEDRNPVVFIDGEQYDGTLFRMN